MIRQKGGITNWLRWLGLFGTRKILSLKCKQKAKRRATDAGVNICHNYRTAAFSPLVRIGIGGGGAGGEVSTRVKIIYFFNKFRKQARLLS